MKNLKDFVKNNIVKLDAVTTSITLEKKHLDFVRRLNLNLSKLIRDYLNTLQKENDNENKKN
jgi:hypothetical protein